MEKGTTQPMSAALTPNEALSFSSSSREAVARTGAGPMVMNLVAGGLGTGMFSLPWSTAGASILPSIGLTLCVVSLNAWTVMILVHAAEAHQVFDLGAVLMKLPGRLGPIMQAFTNAMIWLALFGSLISYLIVMHDSATKLPFIKGTALDSRLPLVTLASLIVLPLCFVPQRFLSFSSGFAFLINVYLIALLCFQYGTKSEDHTLPDGICYLGFGMGTVAMITSLMQCIIIQMCILPMYEELENRTPSKFFKVIVAAFGILCCIFCVFATVGYQLFGPGVQSNVLNDLPPGLYSDIAQAGIIGVVSAVFPIMVIPMIAPVKNMSREIFAAPDLPAASVSRRRSMITTGTTVGIVAVSCVGALFIDELGVVNTIDGSLCVGVFTALGPSMVGYYLIERNSLLWKVAMGMLLLLGLITSVLGFVFNTNYSEQIATSCLWPASAKASASVSAFEVRI